MSEPKNQSGGEEHAGEEYSWEAGWKDHEDQQRRRLAKLSLEQKLVWLEEAHRLIRNLQKSAERPKATNAHQDTGQ